MNPFPKLYVGESKPKPPTQEELHAFVEMIIFRRKLLETRDKNDATRAKKKS